MSKHSPTPWGWTVGTPLITREWGDKKASIAKVLRPEWHEDRIKASEEAGANAEFIVRACNLHEALLAAAQSVITTANGNTYGLSEAEQLEALRLACGDLETAITAAEGTP